MYIYPHFKCTERLDKIIFPLNKIHFLFANYAFENLRNEQLEPTIKKCIENMECGAVILMKEPYPADKDKIEFIVES